VLQLIVDLKPLYVQPAVVVAAPPVYCPFAPQANDAPPDNLGACHVTGHTSHVTRHTSHVTRHTSHVTCSMSNVSSPPPPDHLQLHVIPATPVLNNGHMSHTGHMSYSCTSVTCHTVIHQAHVIQLHISHMSHLYRDSTAPPAQLWPAQPHAHTCINMYYTKAHVHA